MGILGAGLVGGFSLKDKFFSSDKYNIPGVISGANFKLGHLLREKINEVPKTQIEIETLIVGGGISGLSAAWWLNRNNYNNFLLLEMDSDVGGNSRYRENSISKYPLGAHYIPLPSDNAKYVRLLFEELNIITSYKNGKPIYNEFYLCADPHERVYFEGHWQEGLLPQNRIDDFHRVQYEEFFNFINDCKEKKGKDNKYLFTIPMEESSQDPEYLKLDTISMADYMKERGWTSEYLNWYVNYCCRDDYGMPKEKVSAWAGIHYFASRVGIGEDVDSSNVLTWPEGNGWISKKLNDKLNSFINKNNLVYNVIQNKKDEFLIDVFDVSKQIKIRYKTKHIIFAAPRYIAKKIFSNIPINYPRDLDYSPWLIANISLSQRPAGKGTFLSWDNVSYYSKSLGYIVANHQDLQINKKEVVITYYLPLDEGDLKQNRIDAYKKEYKDWLDVIIPDLEKMHKGISKFILDIDLWVWGHGMVSPGINFLWGKDRKKMLEPIDNIVFAHSDMSGISIFEEAQYRGCKAAEEILKKEKK
jgi:hypothetical protein